MNLSPKPVSSKVLNMLQEIRSRIKAEEAVVNNIGVSILIWGPSPAAICKVSSLRIRMRARLNEGGDLAQFSEELVEEKSNLSIKVQQLIQAMQFDLIVSIPTSYGAIAEIHDFISDSRVNKKMMIFLDETFEYGYSFQSLLATATQNTYGAIPYRGNDELHKIEEAVYEAVNKIREIKYLNLGKWL